MNRNDGFSSSLPGEEGEELDRKYLTFGVGGKLFGLPIRSVVEIVQMQPISAMPELPPYAKGIINLRGRVIPVIDMNLRFGSGEMEYTPRTCIVILDLEGGQVGFIVDEVREVLDLPAGSLSPPPSLSGAGARYVTAIGRLEESMVLLLDCTLLLQEDLDALGAAYRG